ncbi:SAM-dependent methyltransferase [Streptomyces bohaiensis]|uniref:Class I SAM-dependent methyltransferase n=2 Tax=Streptomyces bohaiensis TaxID=1431344 RepID=A0ABX1C887_9ACTN|nr:class I SAM-dependent methyltransferase [Streptomyces bohaiensis]NJQ14298.1 class I SAM-dependent methyltransferase [Streptomyces bohaiensis]
MPGTVPTDGATTAPADPAPTAPTAAATPGPDGRTEPDEQTETEFWDARYAAEDRIWSGRVNAPLVEHTAELAPGSALDLGAGEGGDALWLAARGWRVTAVDISRVALERAAALAAERGVADRIDWQHHDLGATFPAGRFDLVSAQFLHSWGPLPREAVLRRAAQAVLPGGTLLVVGHAEVPGGRQQHDHRVRLPGAAEVRESLGLAAGWEVEVCADVDREGTRPDGTPLTFRDAVLRARRTG